MPRIDMGMGIECNALARTVLLLVLMTNGQLYEMVRADDACSAACDEVCARVRALTFVMVRYSRETCPVVGNFDEGAA